MVNKKYLILLVLFPLVGHAEGQDIFSYIIHTIDFIKVFGIWSVTILIAIPIINSVRTEKLNSNAKKMIWLSTGVIAMFVWLLITLDL